MSQRRIGTITYFRGAALVALMSTAILVQGAKPGWSQWRGPHRDGTVTTPLPATWPATLTRRWELTAGARHSSLVVAGDRVVIQARQVSSRV
jgi:hypothetical protein